MEVPHADEPADRRGLEQRGLVGGGRQHRPGQPRRHHGHHHRRRADQLPARRPGHRADQLPHGVSGQPGGRHRSTPTRSRTWPVAAPTTCSRRRPRSLRGIWSTRPRTSRPVSGPPRRCSCAEPPACCPGWARSWSAVWPTWCCRRVRRLRRRAGAAAVRRVCGLCGGTGGADAVPHRAGAATARDARLQSRSGRTPGRCARRSWRTRNGAGTGWPGRWARCWRRPWRDAAVRGGGGPAVPVVIVPVPSTASAVRARQGDHMARLAAHAVRRLRAAGWQAELSSAAAGASAAGFGVAGSGRPGRRR